ncbi:NAD(P)-binding protein [Aspergillus homomorphus CBS 101889]|uniref:NAD(P)-binding protein n=1 Tax=Aspergillus homomorphus (strain CBS 101889) TaxID=1450537 RepID=A0A395HYQ8_ASPHC|nr:NAD(P)-binding protein [Aspergillus homomorphus CBS 101889]RAL12595.1 NAD(P)-binding protein [Aspergillus homomorphus CBS 101889]
MSEYEMISTQRRNLPLLATPETSAGKTYIITGANTGLGFEAAKHFVALCADKVILAVRNLESGAAAQAAIEEATGRTGVAEVWHLDLASFDSVQAFARRADEELERIDALVENAAVAMMGPVRAEGHLLSVTVNVLSTLLLAVLLAKKMRESAKRIGGLARVVVVTSRLGFMAQDDWMAIAEDPLVGIEQDEKLQFNSYALSKLMEILALKHLATLLPVERTGVVFNLVCPGLCKTELIRNAPADYKAELTDLHTLYGRTAEDGSRTLLHGAVAGDETHGCLLHSCEMGEIDVPSWVTDEKGKAMQERLWNALAKKVESIQPGCIADLLDV